MLKRHAAAICIGLALLVLLGTVYLSRNQADYDNRTLQPSAYDGMTTERLFFEKGTYTFAFTYTYTPDAEVQIVRSMTADENNELPMVLASSALSESGQTAITLTFDETVYDLQLRFTREAALGYTNINSAGPVWSDMRLTLLLIVLITGIPGWMALRERRGRNTPLRTDAEIPESTIYLLLLGAALYITLPIIRDFFIKGHDLSFHLIRIEAVKDGLLDGQFPVRIGPNSQNRLGYATSIMYPELFLYVPAVFRLCGVSLMGSYQAFVFLINLATLLVAYHAVKKLTGSETIGLITALVYGLNILRMIMLYSCASLGELLALIFLPCVMLGMYEALHQGKLSKWLVAGMTGLIQTHVVSLEIAAIACVVYTVACAVLRKTSLRALLRLAEAAGITVLLNLWFLAPFLRFLREDFNMFHSSVSMAEYAAYPVQLFASFVDPFGKAELLGTTAEMPVSVGLPPLIGILLYIFAGRRNDRTLRGVGRVSLGFGLGALIISSTLFPWAAVQTLPVLGDLLSKVQYPWRYLGIAALFLSLVFGVGAYAFCPNRRKLLISACVILTVFNVMPFLDQYVQSNKLVYVMREKTNISVLNTFISNDYSYTDADNRVLIDIPAAVAASGDTEISGFSKRGTHISFDYSADTGQTVTLPLCFYPGYAATLDGEQALAPIDGENHLLALSLPAGEGTVAVWYDGFWYFNAANFVSLCTLLACAGWMLFKRRRKRTA